MLWKGYTEFDEAFARMGERESALENPSLAPLAATVLWVIFSAAYFVRQLVRPGVDYPRAHTGEQSSTEPADAGSKELTEPTEVAETDTESTDEEDEPDSTDVQWLTPLLLAAVTVAYAFVLQPVGFLVSTAVFFFAAIWILGSKHLLRDGIIGVILSAAVYFGFTELLSISLPPLILGDVWI